MSVFKKTINNFLEEVEENENIGEDLENEKVSFFLSGSRLSISRTRTASNARAVTDPETPR